MMNSNHIIYGLIFGIAAPALAMVIVYFVGFSGFKFIDFFRYSIAQDFLQNLVSLCGLANLPLFYLYIRNDCYESVRGVIMATFLLVIIVIILKFWI